MDKKRVFISYKHNTHPDVALANALYKHFHELGYEIFFDVETLRGGQSWGDEIERNIEQSDYFICLVSQSAIESPMVRQEIRTAYTSRSKNLSPVILPVMIGTVDLGYEFGAYLSEIQQLFYRSTHATVEEIHATIQDNKILDVNQQKEKVLEQHIIDITVLIEEQLYPEAYRKCVDLYLKGPNSPILNLLTAIAYLLDVGENKLRRQHLDKIEKHIAKAVADHDLRPTALAILGCIKYNFCKLNRQFDPPPFTLSMIKEELAVKPVREIDSGLLGLINPLPQALGELGISIQG